ncbi:MAG TPA: cohesin domain-containing protein [Burkholderiales bacterium]|nr:cohesin domain-containing protein [Burkholderiales bacterium]
MPQRTTLCTLFFAALLLLGAPRSESAIISVGTFPDTNPAPPIAIPSGDFLVPIKITGAVDLQTFQFDLAYDPNVVQEVDPGDGSSGIYGAQFKPGDPNSESFILGGFPLTGLVDDVAGSYPNPPFQVSGDGILAYILFSFVPGHETQPPGFAIGGVVIPPQEVPAPSTLALLAAALLILTFSSRRLSHIRLPDMVSDGASDRWYRPVSSARLLSGKGKLSS